MPFRRRRSLARAERKEWIGNGTVTPTVVAVNALTAVVMLTNPQLEEFAEPRLARIIGTMFISPATAPAAASGYGVFLGISRVNTAGGTGPTVDPELNLDWPSWIWWNAAFPQIGGTAAADSNASRWVGYLRFDWNLRTHVRLREFDQINLSVKNSSFSAASIQFSWVVRLLLYAGRK